MRTECVFVELRYRDGQAYTVWREYRWDGQRLVSISGAILRDLD